MLVFPARSHPVLCDLRRGDAAAAATTTGPVFYLWRYMRVASAPASHRCGSAVDHICHTTVPLRPPPLPPTPLLPHANWLPSTLPEPVPVILPTPPRSAECHVSQSL